MATEITSARANGVSMPNADTRITAMSSTAPSNKRNWTPTAFHRP